MIGDDYYVEIIVQGEGGQVWIIVFCLFEGSGVGVKNGFRGSVYDVLILVILNCFVGQIYGNS